MPPRINVTRRRPCSLSLVPRGEGWGEGRLSSARTEEAPHPDPLLWVQGRGDQGAVATFWQGRLSMRKSFYLIDGHAQIYRAYFAPFRDLTGPNGEPTKATYVFTQMLLNLIDQRRPDYLAMVIDGADEGEEEAPVFRQTIYPEYKANRKAPPDDFHPQEA